MAINVKYSYNQPTPGVSQKTQSFKSPIQQVLAAGPKAYTPAAPAAAPVKAVDPLSYATNQPASTSAAFTPPSTPPPSPLTGAPPNLDYQSDPVLQQIEQNQQSAVAGQVGTTNSAIKQALIGFGDPNLAQKATFFTVNPDQTTVGDAQTAQAAAANPTSTVAQLLQAHNDRTNQLNNDLNASNLYYSSTRGNQLANEDQTYLNDQANAQSQLYGALTDAVNQLLGVRGQSEQAIEQGTQDAYNRALQAYLGTLATQQPTYTTPDTGTGDNGGGGGGALTTPLANAAALASLGATVSPLGPLVTRNYTPNASYAAPATAAQGAQTLAALFGGTPAPKPKKSPSLANSGTLAKLLAAG